MVLSPVFQAFFTPQNTKLSVIFYTPVGVWVRPLLKNEGKRLEWEEG